MAPEICVLHYFDDFLVKTNPNVTKNDRIILKRQSVNRSLTIVFEILNVSFLKQVPVVWFP